MGILDKILSPTGLGAKALFVLGLLLGASVFAIVLMSVYVVNHVTTPPRLNADIPPDTFFRPTIVEFSTPSGSREGWFFPGLKGAPTIIVCHGYGSGRADFLTMVSALQEHQYNAFIFDFAGHGKSSGRTSFGAGETKEVLAAINELANRDDVDKDRFGIWGVDLGGYAALSAAAGDKRIQAVAVESVFDSPNQMLNLQLERSGLTRVPLLSRFSGWIFTVMNFSSRKDAPLTEKVKSLAGIPKLFIQTRANPQISEVNRQLFISATEPKEQSILAKPTYAAMQAEEKKEYENSLVVFFLAHLPIGGKPASQPPR